MLWAVMGHVVALPPTACIFSHQASAGLFKSKRHASSKWPPNLSRKVCSSDLEPGKSRSQASAHTMEAEPSIGNEREEGRAGPRTLNSSALSNRRSSQQLSDLVIPT